MEIDTFNAIVSHKTSIAYQMTNLSKQLNEIKVNAISSTQLAPVHELCSGNHPSNFYEGNSSMPWEKINYMGSPPRAQNKSYSNT